MKTYYLQIPFSDMRRLLFEKSGHMSYLLAARGYHSWELIPKDPLGFCRKQEQLGVEISQEEAAMILFQCKRRLP